MNQKFSQGSCQRSRKYLFLDRDGTLIDEPPGFQVDSIEQFKLLPDVITALVDLKRAGYSFVMITNQDRLGTDYYPLKNFNQIQKILLDILETQGILFESIFICPHTVEDQCSCRKPLTGLLREYLASSDWNRKESYVVGDRATDLALAENLGVTGIQLTSERGWKAIVLEILKRPRTASVVRRTRETSIEVKVNLEFSDQSSKIQTGLGFFDHMLQQLSFHGGFYLEVVAQGDLHIDDHHTVEDIGLALGQAMDQALGDKIGVGRYGFFLPMDDAAVQVALDLSGRSYFLFDGKWNREQVGGLSTEMIPHFFRSFAESLHANLHIRLQGENTHHMAEAVFKAVGRSLRSAIYLEKSAELGVAPGIPSTKGCL